METTSSRSNRFSDKIALQKMLLFCGIFSSLLYVAMNIFIARQYKGYNSASQTVSELSAIGAPTRQLWVSWSFVYTFLILGFGSGIVLSANGNRTLRLLGLLVFIYGAFGFGWPFAPMHMRDVIAVGGGTLSDTIHIVFSALTVCLMLLAMGLSAVTFGRWFRLYVIMTIIIQVLFGMLTFLDAPSLEANLPTPLIGVWERINIGVFMLWVVVVAVLLMRRKESANSIV